MADDEYRDDIGPAESYATFRTFANHSQSFSDSASSGCGLMREIREMVAAWDMADEHKEQHLRLQLQIARAEEALLTASTATAALAATWSAMADNEI